MPGSTRRFALLGLLAREQLTGEQLGRRLRTGAGDWSPANGEVQDELARLEDEGLVRHRVVGTRAYGVRRYALTALGRDALVAWVLAPAPAAESDDLMLRLHSLWLVDRDAAVVLLRDRIEGHEQRLASYDALLARLPPPCGVLDPAFGTRAALRRGRSYERHAADCCRALLTDLGET